MSSVYDLFGTDRKAEVEGIWLVYPYGEFLISRAGPSNTEFTKVFEKLSRPYRTQIKNDMLPSEVGERLLVETFARTIVRDWKKVAGRDGKEIKFSVENCIKVFTDLPDLFADIREQSMKFTNFVTAEIEEDSGN